MNNRIKCIYCLEDKPPDKYKKREHVIPQCFGTFSPDNLILHKCVCDDCNQFFGDKLELFLARDSYESIERIKHGIGSKEPLKDKRRIKSKVLEGEYKGMIVEEVKADTPGEIGIRNSIQAGFYNRVTNEYVYYEPKDIPSAEQLEKNGYDLKKTIWLIANESEYPQLIEALKEKGIKITAKADFIQRDPPVGSLLIEREATIDRTISRALSKIAFNYLTYITKSEIVLRKEFNGIRQFIRFGEGELKQYFTPNVIPILHDEQKLKRFKVKITQGHLINVEWRGNAIISKVSPFNSFTYAVMLCSNYKGIWVPINSGHHFDINTRKISKLISVSKRIII